MEILMKSRNLSLIKRFFTLVLSSFMLLGACAIVGAAADNNVGAYGIGAYKTGEYYKFTQSESKKAKLVSVGESGELVYADYDGKGGNLIDFSYAGYKHGNEPIPDVKVVKTIDANYRTNHTALIQSAIDEVAALPLEERGAILLKAGKYTITDTIRINASGIVLRGEGQGEDGTVIYDARTKTNVVSLEIKGGGYYTLVSKTKTSLVDDYVPMGSTTLKLSDVSVYKVGDSVGVTCTPNNLWVQTLGMDVIPQNSDKSVKQWNASDFVMTYERWITDIDEANNTVTLNTGIPLTFDSKYYSVTVQGIKDHKDRISECGVENIRFLSHYDQSVVDKNGVYVDENHAWTAVALSNCRNCFVRYVTAKHYGFAAVSVSNNAIAVTVEGCSCLEPVSQITGSRRYAFNMGKCQYTLFKNCYSYESRHDYVLGSKVCGPNVFLDSVAESGNAACEPHFHWSTGTLYDNIHLQGIGKLGYIQLINRGRYGTGHGWACANSVMWNCLAPSLNVGKPQTEQNFAVGVYGIYDIDKAPYLHGYKQFVTPSIVTPNYPETQVFTDSSMHGNGYIESPHNPVDPSSLYKAQLSYRLYGDARANVKPCAPLLQYPAPDDKADNYSLNISGVCDIKAEKVFVWVDGEKHEAVIAHDLNHAFSLTLDLADGYYDICVSQVIDGVESDRCAVRSVLVESKVPYTPPAEETEAEIDDTSEPTDTTVSDNGSENENKTDSKKGSVVLPAVIASACVLIGGIVALFVVKKRGKNK